MSEHHVDTGEVDHSEEVFDMVFPSSDESSEVVHPGEESFHFPASAVAAELSSVLGLLFAVAAVGRDHSDPYSSAICSSRAAES